MSDHQTFLNNDRYHALVDALLHTGDRFLDLKSVIIEALRQVGGVWPESVKDDPEFEASTN